MRVTCLMAAKFLNAIVKATLYKGWIAIFAKGKQVVLSNISTVKAEVFKHTVNQGYCSNHLATKFRPFFWVLQDVA